MTPKRKRENLVCPRCGNTHIVPAGVFYQCTKDPDADSDPRIKRRVLEGFCAYLGAKEEFMVQKGLKKTLLS